MEDVASLILSSVRVNGRAALVSAFPNRLVIVDPSGTKVIPMRDLARITHKAGLRTGRLGIVTVDGEEIAIKGLRSGETPTAYQILVRLASAAQ